MIHVLIVTDIRFYREGLAEILPRNPRLCVVGTASHGEEALARVGDHNPDIVLLDTAMPDGIQIVAHITDAAPQVKVVAIGLAETERDVIRWAEAGVMAYVPRTASLDDLIAAVESAAAGELHCSPRIAGGLFRELARLARLPDGPQATLSAIPLTRREREIVELIDQGMSNKKIAHLLGIRVATVKNHVHSILEKLHLHRRGEAAAWVRREGLRRVPHE